MILGAKEKEINARKLFVRIKKRLKKKLVRFLILWTCT
jgi:hypothetical protein